VPPQDIARIDGTAGFRVLQGPSLMTVHFGMDQGRDELLDMPGSGWNPFKDKHVREAFHRAIDIEAIQRVVMRGAANPAGLLIAPGIAGFDAELNERFPYDPELAKTLLAEAGYADGFPVTIDCPNDRYVNDEAICAAVAGMLNKVGVAAEVNAQTKSKHFAKAGSAEGYNTSMYMLGWIPGTYDAHHVLHNLMTLDAAPEGSGIWNAGKWTNPRVEELTKAIASEMDPDKRTAMIHEALRIHKEDFGALPLHQQALAWGVSDSVAEIKQAPNDFLILEEVRMQ
jgi:peptide/nickel transport system substrate-binding protein